MRKLLAFLFCLGLAAGLAFAETRYVLRLKNGGKVITDRYWEEKGQIKCQRGDIVVGFKKEAILSIEELKAADDGSVATDTTTDKKPGADPSAPAGETSTKETTDSPPPSVPAEGTTQQEGIKTIQAEYLAKRDELQSKIDGSLVRFHRHAAEGNVPAKQQALQEATDLSKEVYAMEDEIKKKNNGVIPDWWKVEKKKNP